MPKKHYVPKSVCQPFIALAHRVRKDFVVQFVANPETIEGFRSSICEPLASAAGSFASNAFHSESAGFKCLTLVAAACSPRDASLKHTLQVLRAARSEYLKTLKKGARAPRRPTGHAVPGFPMRAPSQIPPKGGRRGGLLDAWQ